MDPKNCFCALKSGERGFLEPKENSVNIYLSVKRAIKFGGKRSVRANVLSFITSDKAWSLVHYK